MRPKRNICTYSLSSAVVYAIVLFCGKGGSSVRSVDSVCLVALQIGCCITPSSPSASASSYVGSVFSGLAGWFADWLTEWNAETTLLCCGRRRRYDVSSFQGLG